MASIKFFTRSKTSVSQIYVRFIVKRGKEFQSKTGLKINLSDWSKEKSLPKQNTAENKQLTIQLKKLEAFILDSYNADYAAGVDFSKIWIEKKINVFFNRNQVSEDLPEDNTAITYLDEYIEFKKSISSTRIDKIRKLNNLKQRFFQYEIKKNKKFDLHEISGKVLIDFKDFLIADCNMMESTASRFIKDFKTVLFDAQNNGKLIHYQIKGFSTGSTNSDYKVFLSFAELEKIKSKKITDPELLLTRDWLILGCYLGQRGSDLLRMNKKMIYTKTDADGNSFRFLEIIQQKTGENVVIPLHDEVEYIIKKYDGDFPGSFSGNPDSNIGLFNRHLKKLCELCGIHDLVKGKVFNDEKQRNEIVETEKCYLISSHVCRRSFATNFYGNKLFTTPQLMAITGHKSESQFLNYIGRTADEWAMQTAKTFREMNKK
ncbi:phage integrase SAM-like domain-containing protein [Chryseobacterium sp. MHB01]|uniref:phage integrase SAM-like domain-containing protein n=1 Tax=Chryseobacterium sp. MHB01 TaxID=3109433 RepID=UPI002AFF5FA9|nr:phage integrase SAM-like domain-containing protein [Chryseobacterium sp. MHB01]MEA1849000.1 phage integrase SAM-like domain-containing protein [Chryseobacterium sp. MHB01]